MNQPKIFDTHVQGIKYKAIRELIKAYDQDRLASAVVDIPRMALTASDSAIRCCIYKARAIFEERLIIAQKPITKDTKSVVELIDIACDECPANGVLVTNACRGCISHKCAEVCPRGCIDLSTKPITIDKSKCIECGLCAKACPYGALVLQKRPCVVSCKVGAITIDQEDKKAHIDEDKCVSCGACVRQCPFGAIQDKSMILDVLRLLDDSHSKGHKVYAIVAPSIASQFTYATIEQVVEGITKLGFERVVEAAMGADVCVAHESDEWIQKGLLLTSCCPSFVSYVQKNFPTLAESLSHSLSPMAETARMLKSGDPDAKCVFIGPCASKKMESQLDKTLGLIDLVLSFEELQAFFDAREVEVAELEGVPLDDASSYGRIFGRSGGIRQGMTDTMNAKGVEGFSPVAMSGLDECKISLSKLRVRRALDNFFEGMACEGGCVNGPLTLQQKPNNAKLLNDHSTKATHKTLDNSVAQYDNGKMQWQD